MSMKLTCGEFVGLAYANDDELREFAEEILAENAKLRDELAKWERLTANIELPEYPITEFKPKDLERENAKLREQMERLVTILRVDCDIEASWDGLRKFWSIELTDGGCLMRDRVCKGEAENAKLRELVADMWNYITEPVGKRNNLKERLARLDDIGDRIRELGVEVKDD